MGFPKDVQTLTRVCLKAEIRIQMLILKASLYFLSFKHKFSYLFTARKRTCITNWKWKMSLETTVLLFQTLTEMCKITFGGGLCYTQNSEIWASVGAKVVSSDQHVFSPNSSLLPFSRDSNLHSLLTSQWEIFLSRTLTHEWKTYLALTSNISSS